MTTYFNPNLQKIIEEYCVYKPKYIKEVEIRTEWMKKFFDKNFGKDLCGDKFRRYIYKNMDNFWYIAVGNETMMERRGILIDRFRKNKIKYGITFHTSRTYLDY